MPGSTTSPVPLGVPGVLMDPGDHICAFYRGLRERDEVLIPYLREGVHAGDKCICIVDATDPEHVLATLGREIDITASVSDRRLEVQSSLDTYLRENGFFPQAMLTFWDEFFDGAAAEGFPFARVVGEMTWSLRDYPGVEELLMYESEFNRTPPRFPQAALCLYDLDHFTGELLMGVLKTHPKVLVCGALVTNPYYLEPDEFLATHL